MSLATKHNTLIPGLGEMSELIRKKNWARTPIGTPDQWPQSLLTSLSILLYGKFPMLLMWGPELICFYNDAFRPSLGSDGKHPSILGQPAEKAWAEVWHIIKPLLDQVLTGGESIWQEDQLVPIFRNGKIEEAYWTFSYSAVLDESAEIAGVLVTCSETTAKINLVKELEASIREVSQGEHIRGRMAAIVESSDDAIISKTFEGIVTSWNKSAERIFGYTPEEMIGQSITKLIPDDRLDEEPKIIEGLKQGKRFDHFETKRITKNKQILDISLTISPVRDASGKLIGAAKIARDITAQKQTEKLVKASEEKFRLLADSMPQFVWTGDEYGNLNYINKKVQTYSGLTLAQIEADGWLQFIHPEDLEENIKRWQRAKLTGEEFLLEHRFRRHDGVFRWYLSRAVPQKDERGKITMWVGTSTDIDDIKKHEQQKDDFIRIASHELKTPVTTIKGYVQLLLDLHKDQKESPVASSLNKVYKQVNKLTKLIADLLDLTRIETGRLQLDRHHYPLSRIIDEVITDIGPTGGRHRIEVLLLDDPIVYVDKERFEQVLVNLITNAVKYSPNAEKVILKVERQDQQALISLTDFGIGIAADDAEKIFERFYRVEGKDEKKFPGFGIGLFIVREIVELHDGKVWVASELKKGSTFYVSLPVN
ncbi:MAG TPA: PAS domain S-box protein [Puia sp.]|nr:PAS domain S-box protein [Puia sp.]